jgi:hypothetical protein
MGEDGSRGGRRRPTTCVLILCGELICLAGLSGSLYGFIVSDRSSSIFTSPSAGFASSSSFTRRRRLFLCTITTKTWAADLMATPSSPLGRRRRAYYTFNHVTDRLQNDYHYLFGFTILLITCRCG